MKIVYCIQSVHNSGGMERVLANKVNYLADILGYEIIIITTDRKQREPFFNISKKIKFIDLKINYEDNSNKSILKKIFLQNSKLKLHKKKLSECLQTIRPDITVSMFGMEVQFLYKLKDGSKKFIEFHFSKRYKIIETNSIVNRIFQKIRLILWERIIIKYEKFIVLTHRDLSDWKNPSNGCVIPNMITHKIEDKTGLEDKTHNVVIAAGRLTYQKGFDLLIDAWRSVKEWYPDWKLYIYGEGELRQCLQNRINAYGLNEQIKLAGNVRDLSQYLRKSDFFVMSSRFEGFPMVLLEAMSSDLPCVSFDCPCGPSDVISNGIDGYLVPPNNVDDLAYAIKKMIEDESFRKSSKSNIRRKIKNYSQDKIMERWNNLFQSVM